MSAYFTGISTDMSIGKTYSGSYSREFEQLYQFLKAAIKSGATKAFITEEDLKLLYYYVPMMKQLSANVYKWNDYLTIHVENGLEGACTGDFEECDCTKCFERWQDYCDFRAFTADQFGARRPSRRDRE